MNCSFDLNPASFLRRSFSRSLLVVALLHVTLACNQSEPPNVGSTDQHEETTIERLRNGELSGLFTSGDGRTAGGLSVENVISLVEQGYELNDVMFADSLGVHYGVGIHELLERYTRERSWDPIVLSLSSSQPGPLPKSAPAGDLIPLVARSAKLSESHVARLIAEGHDITDIALAGRYAIDNGISIERALQANTTKDWAVTGRQLAMSSRFEPTAQLVERTGLDRTTLDGLLAQGHLLTDIMQAGAISKATRRPVEDILRLRNGRDWAAVIGELLPGADLPTVPSALVQPPASGAGVPVTEPAEQAGKNRSGAAHTLYCVPHVHHELLWEPGYWVYYQYWQPVYHPGYYVYYYTYNWWCGCWTLDWYYVPGWTEWVLSWGSYYVPGYWYDYTWTTCDPVDTTPPSSSLSRSPASPDGANGWYVGPITINLSATDYSLAAAQADSNAITPKSVSKIEYNLNNGSWQTYTGAFTISTDGNWTLRYRATDDYANVEPTHTAPTISLDRVAPSISSTRTQANNYGWNNGDVTVNFACSDATSGVDSCSGAITLSSQGAAQSVIGSARDKAGHNASQTVGNINIDKTGPSISITGGGDYTVDKTIQITCTAADSLSGLTQNPCASPLVAARAYKYNPGTYSVSVNAADKADNTASAHASYTIKVTADSLGNVVEEFVTPSGNPDITKCMRLQLEAIEASTAAGQIQSRAIQVETFTHEVQVYAGTVFTAEQAEVLIRLVNFL